jgi:catechol 2,3-dioxygenase-like lactoylglutathione lyase family enzyme
MPNVMGILETALYVADLERAAGFYETVFGFDRIAGDDRFCAFGVADKQVLLLFKHGGSRDAKQISGGKIPPHDASGQIHMALAIDQAQWAPWLERLAVLGIPIESEVQWPRGGRSLYFRDLDRHLLELVTPGCWSIY